MTLEAIISPATDGTKPVEPGTTFLLSLLKVITGFSGCSSENTVRSFLTFLDFNYFLSTFASGHI